MELTDKELASLHDMLQTYRELQEEIYTEDEQCAWDGNPETLFTKTQLKLFNRFDVVSIKYNTNK